LQHSCSHHARIVSAKFRPTRGGIYDTVVLTKPQLNPLPRY
jgi:hypothetical protein